MIMTTEEESILNTDFAIKFKDSHESEMDDFAKVQKRGRKEKNNEEITSNLNKINPSWSVEVEIS